MGVHESQVSRGERNEYHGITVGRVMMILDITDPANPQILSNGGVKSRNVAIAGDCVYIAKGAGGIKVLPIQN